MQLFIGGFRVKIFPSGSLPVRGDKGLAVLRGPPLATVSASFRRCLYSPVSTYLEAKLHHLGIPLLKPISNSRITATFLLLFPCVETWLDDPNRFLKTSYFISKHLFRQMWSSLNCMKRTNRATIIIKIPSPLYARKEDQECSLRRNRLFRL